jgi:hypothetical protein
MSEVLSEIAKLAQPLWAKHEELATKRDGIAAELETVNGEIRQIEKVLRAVDPDKFVRENTNSSGVYKDTERNAAIILRTMWQEPHLNYTVTILANKTNLTNSQVQTALQHLRAQGDVRSIGRVAKAPGQMGAAPVGYKIADGAVAPEGPLPEPEPRQTHPQRPKGSTSLEEVERRVSPARMAKVREFVAAQEGEFSRADLRAAIPELSEAATGFAFQVLELRGEVNFDPNWAPGNRRRKTYTRAVNNGG